MVQVCFVCLGNICRSPTAEAVMRHLVRQSRARARDRTSRARAPATGTSASRATGAAWRPVRRAASRCRGARSSSRAADFARFDHVVAMDQLEPRRAAEDGARRPRARAKVTMLRAYEAGDAGASRRGARSVLRRLARVRGRLRHLPGGVRGLPGAPAPRAPAVSGGAQLAAELARVLGSADRAVERAWVAATSTTPRWSRWPTGASCS